MAITDFNPKIWSARILRHAELLSSFIPFTDRSFEAEASISGSVNIPIDTHAVALDTDDTPTQDNLVAADVGGVVLNLNKRASFDIGVDDIHIAQSKPDILDSLVARGMNSVVTAMDTDLAKAFVYHADRDATAINVSASGFKSRDSAQTAGKELHTFMNGKNMPLPGRWCIVPKNFGQDLFSQLSDNLGEYGTAPVAGSYSALNYIGFFGGIEWYMDIRGVRANATRSGSSYYDAPASQGRTAVAFGMSVVNIEAYRSRKAFRSRVRALVTYGSVVLDATRLWYVPVVQA